jgi:hypothetical protein
MTCSKCGGLVVAGHGEARCLNCGRYWFQADKNQTECSQCDHDVWRDGLCQVHWQARMEMVNRYTDEVNRVRK